MKPFQMFFRSGGSALASLSGLAFALGLGLATPTHGLAGESDSTSSMVIGSAAVKSLQLGVGRSMIVDLPEDAAEIFVGEPKVANAIVRSPRRLYISTLAAGQTTIFALTASGRKIATLEITVGRDVGELAKLFDAAIPGNDIHVKTVGGSIILTGSVASAGDAQKALDIAQGFLSDNNGSIASAANTGGVGAAGSGGGGVSLNVSTGGGGSAVNGNKVVNALTIRGLDQVSLRVTVSEIRRDIIKQLGVSYSGGSTTGSGLTALNIANPLGVNGAIAEEGATLAWKVGSSTFAATLQAFEQQGVARTLAEPTVTAVSGESAKFLAGGTIPIANSETCGTVTSGIGCTIGIIQQAYGVSLSFTPVVLSQSRIQLRIATEVTDVDPSKAINVDNIAVPGFRTRKNETTVELPSGGSIASAGLISSQSATAVSGVPGLMNLPVLGSLFRSRDYQRQETELLIIVTPFIVHAVDPQQVQRPEKGMYDATDPAGWLLGRVNRIYSTNTYGSDKSVNYTGKIGFITD
jgi:pilus assembly protein CpaC